MDLGAGSPPNGRWRPMISVNAFYAEELQFAFLEQEESTR